MGDSGDNVTSEGKEEIANQNDATSDANAENEETDQEASAAAEDAVSNDIDKDRQSIPEVEESEENEELNLRDEESKLLGGADILFSRISTQNYNGWDNLRWMAYSGTRRLKYFEPVYRFFETPKSFFAFVSGEEYQDRCLAVYEEPNVILILRRPEHPDEVKVILDVDDENLGDFSVYWVVESVVDPHTCKLRLSPLTTVTSVLEGVQANEFRRRSCFELVTPMQESSIILSAVIIRGQAAKTSFIDSGAFLETSSAEHCLKKSICEAFKKDSAAISDHDSSWRHQIILGTLHSYVVLANKTMLDEGIQSAMKAQMLELQRIGAPQKEADFNYLAPRIVDALDEGGRSPLHYACSNRFTAAVLSLLKVGANVDMRVEPLNETPLHLCAKKLDDKSMSAILAINRRPNTVDKFGRTPMYVSITEGCTVGGKSDPEALDRCLTALEAHDGDLGDLEGFRHPFSYLAQLINHEVLSVVLKHVKHVYPLLILPNREGLPDRMGMSTSALYHYPIHSALESFRHKVRATCEGKDAQQLWNFCAEADGKLVKTLEVLFSAGFEPNERMEGLVDIFNGSDELAHYIGFSPLQILAAAALDTLQYKEMLGETLFLGVVSLISNVAEFLVKNGARLSLDPPPMNRLRKSLSSASTEESSTGGSANYGRDLPMRRSELKMQANPQLIDMLGGTIRLNAAQEVWKSMKSPESLGGSLKFHIDKLAIDDSAAPGGSDEKSCAICWRAFGKLVNRKHRCRISRRHVCDECSTKRVLCDGEEHRVSDGQFLFAKADEARRVLRRVFGSQVSVMEEERKQKDRKLQQNTAASRLEKLEAQEKANRDSLFGNVLGSVGKALFGDDPDEEQDAASQANNSLAGLTNQLNETRDALNLRGEKLNTLAEKSDRLASASEDFAKVATELNRQSQSWW